ncbi:MAG: hypothetical protein ACM3UN_04485, partial [Bacillota bacterium]
DLVNKITRESVGITLTIKKEELIECTNPRKLVETYKVQGGPSPEEVVREITSQNKTLKETKTNIAKLQASLSTAEKTLNLTVESYISNSSKNGRLKNSKL